MITLTVKKARNPLQKIIGLIGKEKAYAFLLETHFGIHTFGMAFPIDIIIIDKHNQVVRLKENMKPNRLYLWNPLYKFVVELPEGTIQEKKITMGERIKLVIE